MTPSGHARRDLIERWELFRCAVNLRPSALFFFQTLLLLATYVVFEQAMERATRLYTERYFEPILFVQLLDRLGWLLCLVTLLIGAAMWRLGHLNATWPDFDHGPTLRKVIGILTLLIAWPFVTIAYNHYFDQPYFLDRGVLALLAIAVWWRPAFLLLFLPQLYLLMGQLIEPTLGGTVLAHKLQVSHALGLMAAAALVHGITRQRSTTPLVFLLVCFVGAQYWIPALAKLRIGWLGSDELHLMPLVAYHYGWFDFLTDAQIITLAQQLKPLDWLMRSAVIAFEGGCLLILWRRGLTRWLLAAGVVFHLGVFVLGGLMFWTWMALDAAVLVLIFNRQRWPLVHGRVGFAMSLVLILGASYWARPPHLGWYITPLSYVYRIDATLADDTIVTLAPEFFAPYEDVFATASFNYTSGDHGVLVSTHGVTRDMAVVRGLRNAKTAADVIALEDGHTRHNIQRTQTLNKFLIRFIGNVNRTGETLSWLQRLQPPLQNYALLKGTEFAGTVPIRTVGITEITTFYDGVTLHKIREVQLISLDVTPTYTVHP